MYSQGSEECMLNAEGLIDDARELTIKGSYGRAQSLSVTALEEVGKAIILKLADLHLVEEKIIHRIMKKHAPKTLVIIGIEKLKFLIGEQLISNARKIAYIIDNDKLEIIKKQIGKDIAKLERKRQSGLYVDIDPVNGRIKNSPSQITPEDATFIINKAEVFLSVGKGLCNIFADLTIRKHVRTTAHLVDIKIPEYLHAPNGTDLSIIITWDEL